jgi:hypothetical protein
VMAASLRANLEPEPRNAAQMGGWVYVGFVAVGIGIALAVSDIGSNGQIANTTAPVTTGTTG